MSKRRKQPPAFRGEAEERAFWESHNSADYVDWSRAEAVRLPGLRPAPATPPPRERHGTGKP